MWKITHVIPALTKGGAERVAVDLANHAARLGHKVSMVAGFHVDDLLLRHMIDAAVCLKYVTPPTSRTSPRAQQYMWMLPWLWGNRRWLSGEDIIHCHLSFGSAVGTAMRALRALGDNRSPRIIETYHAVGMAVPRWRRSLHSVFAGTRDALALMAEDEYWAAFVARHPGLKSTIIPNGIALPSSDLGAATKQTYRRAIGIPDGCRLVMGTVGMLRADRQPWRFIEIFGEVARTLGPDVHFVIAGDGMEMERLQADTKARGLEKCVHFPGVALDPSLPRSIMDLYVTLNVGATTGLAAMEATAEGRPVVALQLLKNHQNRADWIWSSSQPAEVARYAVELLQSPAQRHELARRQRTYVEAHHTVDAMANKYYALYETVLRESRLPA